MSPINIQEDEVLLLPVEGVPEKIPQGTVTTVFSQKPKSGQIGEEKMLLSAKGIYFYSREFVLTFAQFMHDNEKCDKVSDFLQNHVSCSGADEVITQATRSCPRCRLKIALRDMVDVMVDIEKTRIGDNKSVSRMASCIEQALKKITREGQMEGIYLNAPDEDDVETLGIRREFHNLDTSYDFRF
jgi:hypothetical protein